MLEMMQHQVQWKCNAAQKIVGGLHLGYLLAMEAHGRQSIMQVCEADPVVLW